MKNDTCVALATNPSAAGLTVLRISGPRAFYFADLLFHKGALPVNSVSSEAEKQEGSSCFFSINKSCDISNMKAYQARLGYLINPYDGKVLDQAIALKFVAPKSYTGENVVEFSFHGGKIIANLVMEACLKVGLRLAEAGEFTLRAFLNGKLDLTQAEAVVDLINSESEQAKNLALSQLSGSLKDFFSRLKEPLLHISAQLELALQYPEHEDSLIDIEHIKSLLVQTKKALDELLASFSRTELIKDGFYVALVGLPNAGKSSLLNAISGEDRAIVTNIEGTTRDLIESRIQIAGNTTILVDTAGLREQADEVEIIGIGKTWEQINKSKIVVWVQSLEQNPRKGAELCLAELLFKFWQRGEDLTKLYFMFNKIDLLPNEEEQQEYIKCFFEQLQEKLLNNLMKSEEKSEVVLSNLKRWRNEALLVSAKCKQGLVNFEELLIKKIEQIEKKDTSVVLLANARQKNILEEIAFKLEKILTDIAYLPWDILSLTLESCLRDFATLTGEEANELLLKEIFSRFCVGK